MGAKFHVLTRQVIAQVELENVIMLNTQIKRMEATRDRIAEGILRKLNAGGEVEEGARLAIVEEEYDGCRRHQKLVIS